VGADHVVAFVFMLDITSLHHVAICVTDIARAKGFYGGLLGLREITRPPFPFEGAWYELADGRQVHLIVHEHPRTLRGTTDIDLRDGHFAFGVSDYDRTVERLQSAGVPCELRPDNVTPWKQVYVTDPDGNVIELNAPR
jgi:glyoxylase I family protein